MGLISERLEWQAMYEQGESPSYVAYHNYLTGRLTESFRLPRELEKFFEYVLCLERRLDDSTDRQ